MVSLEVLEVELKTHAQESQRQYNQLSQSIIKLEEVVNGVEKYKVSYKTFWLVLSFMITVLTTMFSYVVYQNSELQKGQYELYRLQSATDQNVSLIKGKLEPYNIEFKD